MNATSPAEGLARPRLRPRSAKLDRMLNTPFIDRLDRRDRALYLRWVISESSSSVTRLFWTTVTHLGDSWVVIAFALAPLLLTEPSRHVAAAQAGWALLISHLVVQVIKRNIVRVRPTVHAHVAAWVAIPDRFSFPSGHSTAVMAVAFMHAASFPSLGWSMLVLAVLVGISRVRLGVHYPGDVLAGHLIAIATGVIVLAAG
jgi:undecaprenyl-diphosphatase